MELRQARYFLMAAEEENFRRAADRLHVAAPALSRQIAALEQELGVQLFVRQRQRVALTSVGRKYAADIREILQRLEDANAHARHLASGKIGQLRVGFHEAAIRHAVVSQTLERFRVANPGVALQLQPMITPHQIQALRDGRIDVSFGYCTTRPEQGIACQELLTDDIGIAMLNTHRCAKKKKLFLRDFHEDSFVWTARWVNEQNDDELRRVCAVAGLTPRINQEAAHESTKLSLIAAGMGVGILRAPEQTPILPQLVVRTVEDLTLPKRLAIFWLRDAPSPLVERLCQIASQAISGAPDAARP